MTPYDIYLVGVGGQGILTIGEILAEAAARREIPVNFYPTKGMAQRGGFVKAQLRLGRGSIGPNIPEKGADLVISTEVSETLKAVRYIKRGGHAVLYGYVWAPTAVVLGKAPYPKVEQVLEQIAQNGGIVHLIAPDTLPSFDGAPVPDNIYVLGVALGETPQGVVVDAADVVEIVRNRWRKSADRNLFALEQGLARRPATA